MLTESLTQNKDSEGMVFFSTFVAQKKLKFSTRLKQTDTKSRFQKYGSD